MSRKTGIKLEPENFFLKMEEKMILPMIYSAVFGLFLFYFFKWVFIERYTNEAARNYAILSAFACSLITFGALI